MEIAGSYFNALIHYIPYTKPLARLGKIRSAGVTDLRFGNLIDEDWQETDRFKVQKDSRKHIPLPEHIEFYSIAADNGTELTPSSQFVGDGLVGIKSALGIHANPKKTIK